jgi:hypothetical protein
MTGRDPAGSGTVTPRDRGEQLAVLGRHRVRAPGALQRYPGRHHELAPQPVEHLQRDRVAGELGDPQMELAVEVDRTLKVARGGDLLEVRRLAFQVGQRRRGQPPGQLLARRELGGQRLERGPHGVRVPHRGRAHRAHPDAPPRAAHQAVAFQAAQRLADRRSAHR